MATTRENLTGGGGDNGRGVGGVGGGGGDTGGTNAIIINTLIPG